MTEDMEDRIRGALWGAFMGDALAMPSHWYYGGFGQVQADYGGPITTYIKPKTDLQGSIMNLSNTGGAGRGSCDGDIIGSVINHGKKKYWERGRSCHYHCTLEAGENTLEAQLLLVLLQSINANDGVFNQDDFRQRYIHFMTTPGTHNDAYASTCHRMFFANLKIRGSISRLAMLSQSPLFVRVWPCLTVYAATVYYRPQINRDTNPVAKSQEATTTVDTIT
ncbi:hypothetical protein CYMTET_36408 [Cymbomonas tetramitiformis]|uniref:ADP-ribosylglycohydrolase n=1 Tax=Cymbomonas tetramitiformis TaxID=36881 RepID=A0AAE0F710_9CHLO|nr:hypothetical protein CYMTET_36408 [Cymbomonas tetramitiformis]